MTNPKKTPAVAEDVYNSFSDDDIDLEDKRNTDNKTTVPKNSAARSTVCSPVCLVCQSSPKGPLAPSPGPIRSLVTLLLLCGVLICLVHGLHTPEKNNSQKTAAFQPGNQGQDSQAQTEQKAPGTAQDSNQCPFTLDR